MAFLEDYFLYKMDNHELYMWPANWKGVNVRK